MTRYIPLIVWLAAVRLAVFDDLAGRTIWQARVKA